MRHRRTSRLLVIAVLAALLVPASGTPAQAVRDGAFEYWYARLVCSGTGGNWGAGIMFARGVYIREYGVSGTDYFKVTFRTQVRNVNGGWSDRLPKKVHTSNTFYDSPTTHTWGPLDSPNWSFTQGEMDREMRILVVWDWMNERPGPDGVVERHRRWRKCISGG